MIAMKSTPKLGWKRKIIPKMISKIAEKINQPEDSPKIRPIR